MKTTKMLTILVLAWGLILSWPEVIEAAPMSTAFIYQGRLIDANKPADGLYDFQFGLFDSASGPNQVGSDVNKPDVNVTDGYFTVELDFGNVFDSNAVWLDIGVRPGDQNDPNTYQTLSPRQPVTPTPYALQIRGLFVDNAGNVGIGTASPAAKLDVAGNARIEGDIKLTNTGSQVKFAHTASGYLINVEDSANAGIYYNAMNNYWEWRGGGVQRGCIDLDNGDSTVTGKVGIGTTSPDRNLDIRHSNSGGGIEIDRSANNIWSGIVYENDGAENWFIGVQSDSNNLLFRDDGARNAIVIEDGTGNVGIATTDPAAKLHLLDPTMYGATGLLESTNVNGLVSLVLKNPGGKWNIAQRGDFMGDAYNALVMREDNATTDALVIQPDGKVGVGLSAPTERLDVYGTARLRKIGDGIGTTVVADANGKLWKAVSSKRYKTNIEDLEIDADAVLELRPVCFQYKSSGQRDVGLVAEDVHEVLSDLVIYDNEGKPEAVKYDRVSLYLLDVVKMLKAENESLKVRLDALESTMHKLAKGKEFEL